MKAFLVDVVLALVVLSACVLLTCIMDTSRAHAMSGSADGTVARSFDDCEGSPAPDDKAHGCVHGGLDNGR